MRQHYYVNQPQDQDKTVLTALIRKAATDPNPTREFIFGDAFANALKPSKSKSKEKKRIR